MLTITIWRFFRIANKQKYFIELALIFIMLVACLVTYFQYEYIVDVYRATGTSAPNKSHDTNSRWQRVLHTSQELHIYTAYYDDREEENFVRIIGLSEPNFNDVIECQLYIENRETEYILVSAQIEAIGNHTEAKLVAVFVTCVLPEGSEIPQAVSLTVGIGLKPSNLVPVQRASPTHDESIVACVAPLNNHYSQHTRLVEFIEMNRILGVDHFIFYKQSVTKQLSCFLSDYAKQEEITVIEWDTPSKETTSERGAQEGHLAAFNDCLYQTMFKYKYVTFLNIDEFIIPKEADSLKHLIRIIENNHNNKQNTGSFEFKVANFYLEWPDIEMKPKKYWGSYLMTFHKINHTITDSNTLVCKPEAVVRVKAQSDLRLISGFETANVAELQALCHRYRQAPADQPLPPVSQAQRDSSAHRFVPRLMDAFLAQYKISMPHCSLDGTDVVEIEHFGLRRIPVLV